MLPRKYQGDPFADKNDEIYPALENNEGSLALGLQQDKKEESMPLHVDADSDRQARTQREMEKEADWLRGFFVSTS